MASPLVSEGARLRSGGRRDMAAPPQKGYARIASKEKVPRKGLPRRRGEQSPHRSANLPLALPERGPKMKGVRLSRPSERWALRPLYPFGWTSTVVHWLGRRVARQAGVSVFFTLSCAAGCLWWLLRLDLVPHLSARSFALASLIVIPTATLLAFWVTTRLLGARLGHLVEVIDSTGPDAELTRIRSMGSDEVGAIAQAVNRLLARITSIRASMIDQQ